MDKRVKVLIEIFTESELRDIVNALRCYKKEVGVTEFPENLYNLFKEAESQKIYQSFLKIKKRGGKK